MTKQTKTLKQQIVFESERDMPYFPIAMGTTEWNETGTWRYMRPRYVQRVPACQNSCPTGNDIEAWIRLLEGGRLAEAWEAAVLENPFPAIMGRVCFHPCMDGCNRRELGGTVNINALERSLGDAMGEKLPPAERFCKSSGKSIAIMGSGPAGLACAYHAARLGHNVVVFERAQKAGGMLRYGIPSYRLPRDVLDREIERLKAMGIDIKLDKPVPDAAHMQTLRQDYAAVFLATGAHRSRAIGLEGEKTPGVMPGLEFLKQTASGRSPQIGRRVIVVGGGNTAVDTARTARRLGAEVTLVYRRSRAEMPAFEGEVRAAEEEGVRIEMLMAPSRLLTANGRATGIECLRMQLGDPDESGRRRPEPVKGSETTFDAETILTAIGEEIDTSIIPAALAIENGAIKTGVGGRTEWHNIFAGGDFTAGPRTVVDALAAGKRTAIAMDCLLRGEDAAAALERASVAGSGPALMGRYIEKILGLPERTATSSETSMQDRIAVFDDVNTAYFTRSEPEATPSKVVAERFGTDPFSEVHQALSDIARGRELSRCFHCGRCTECDNCYIYCPDVAILKQEGGFGIDMNFCKGCGVCNKECPRAAMEMIEEPTEF
ncbi:MAG: NAD(P)-binding protein [bacterium]